MIELNLIDRLCASADTALRTVFAKAPAHAFDSDLPQNLQDLTPQEAKHSGNLMRVNHVGEVCAQALYSAQSLMTQDVKKSEFLQSAAREEEAHLSWTEQRLHELGAKTSVLNPVWYTGAFALGLLAGKMGDEVSLGFVMETERQVEQHLGNHLMMDDLGLAAHDLRSRAIVRQMQLDEAAHGTQARAHGGVELAPPIQHLMRIAAKVMTTTAYRV